MENYRSGHIYEPGDLSKYIADPRAVKHVAYMLVQEPGIGCNRGEWCCTVSEILVMVSRQQVISMAIEAQPLRSAAPPSVTP